jgi:hypothetical protein
VTGATIQCLGHSANPAIEIWSCWLDSHQHRPAYKAGAFVCRPQPQTLELARSLELRSGAYRAPALPVELYQRSWRGDSNADHGLTGPALFPLSYTSTKLLLENLEVAGRIALPIICFAGRRLAVLATPPQKYGAEGGTRTRGNVASWPLDDFRPHEIMERAARVELASSAWKAEAPAAIPCSLFTSGRGDRIRTCLNSFWRRAPFPSGHHPCGGRNGS